MTYTNRPGTGPLDLQMGTHIAAAEIALTAAITATSDESTRETYRGLLNLLVLAAASVPSERPALLDEVLTALVFRSWPRESTSFVIAAMGDVATAHVAAVVLARD